MGFQHDAVLPLSLPCSRSFDCVCRQLQERLAKDHRALLDCQGVRVGGGAAAGVRRPGGWSVWRRCVDTVDMSAHARRSDVLLCADGVPVGAKVRRCASDGLLWARLPRSSVLQQEFLLSCGLCHAEVTPRGCPLHASLSSCPPVLLSTCPPVCLSTAEPAACAHRRVQGEAQRGRGGIGARN